MTTINISAHVTPKYATDDRFMMLANDPVYVGKTISNAWDVNCACLEKLSIHDSEDDGHKNNVELAVLKERLAAEVKTGEAVWQERIKNLEEQLAFERSRFNETMAIKCKQNSSYGRGVEGERMVFHVLLEALKFNEKYKIENHSKIPSEADIHVVNTTNKKRIVIEVKNRNSAVEPKEVGKVYTDIEHLMRKYSDEFIGYIFVSLCGNQRIPTKGYSCLEWANGLPVFWTSLDIESDGYVTLRAFVMDRISVIEGLSTDKPKKRIFEDVDQKDDAMCDLEDEVRVFKVLAQSHEVELTRAYDSYVRMECEAKAGKARIAAHLLRRQKEVVKVAAQARPCNDDEATVQQSSETEIEMFKWQTPERFVGAC